jgi:RNA recognition motif-containing protein
MEELSQTSTTSQPQESNTLSQPSDVKQNPEAMLNPTNNNLNSQNSDENQYLYKSELFPQNVIPSNSEPLTENKKRPLDEREEHSESTSSPPSKKPRIEEQEKEYNSTVFLGNLPSDVTEGMLSEIFSKVGTVKSVKLNKHADTGKVKGYLILQLLSITKERFFSLNRF